MSLDSRAARPHGLRPLLRRFGAIILGQPVYCLSCGSQDGYVPVGLPPGVFYLCGACEGRYGVPDVLKRRPDLDAERTN